jgi:hypothetical protein
MALRSNAQPRLCREKGSLGHITIQENANGPIWLVFVAADLAEGEALKV